MTHSPHAPGCIRFEGVSYAYGSTPVLENANFSVTCGEYVGIVGPNGGGKSTLVKLLAGLLEPSAGQITVYGQPPKDARKGGRIGYVPQRVAQQEFPFPATVEEVVKSGRTPRIPVGSGFGKADTDAVEEALQSAEIAHLRHRRIGDLSGGERQRAFIARALAGKPHILILDEPTTGVDPGARDRFYAFLRTLNTKQGLTILFVTHDVDVMVHEAKTILCVNQTVLCHVAAKKFKHDESLKQLYGESVSRIDHHHH